MKKFFEPYKGLPTAIYVLFFSTIVNNLGNFVAPYLVFILTGKAGFSETSAGLFASATAILSIGANLLGGKLIDKIGRKKIPVACKGLAALTYAMCAFVESPYLLVALLASSNFIMGFAQPAYSTLVADITKGEQRKVAYSLNYMAINIGYAVGPMLAGLLYKNHINILFLGDAATSILSLMLIILFVPETKPTEDDLNKAKGNESAVEGSAWEAMKERPSLMIFCGIIVIYFIAFSQFNFGLPLQVKDIFGESGPAKFGFLMSINAVVCSIFTTIIISITKNLKPSQSIAIGGLFYAVGFGMMAFISSYKMFMLSVVIWSIGEVLVSTNTGVYLADHTPITHRGRFNSIFPIIRRLGSASGPLLAGFMISGFGIRNLWVVVAVLTITASVMIYKLYLKYDREEVKEMVA